MNFLTAALTVTFLCNGIATANENVPQNVSQETSRQKILSIFAGEWVARGLYTAVKLEIADHLNEGSKSIEELAVLSHSNPDSLHRLLQMLAGYDIFEELSPGVFANTNASRLLVSTEPDSLNALSRFYGEEIHQSLSQIAPSIQSGTPAFNIAFKQPVFSYFKDNPDSAALFQQAMKEKTKAVIDSTLQNYDFGKFNTFCDVGGGYGQFIQAILEKHPKASGMVFELPEVIGKVRMQNPCLESDRFKLVAGDFFENVPQGNDVYLLKSVIHDWDDAKAEQILKNCREAMRPDSRLLLIEVVLQPHEKLSYAHCMDFLMMAITGGKERSVAAMTQLLEKSGFSVIQIHPTTTEFSIIEAKIQ